MKTIVEINGAYVPAPVVIQVELNRVCPNADITVTELPPQGESDGNRNSFGNEIDAHDHCGYCGQYLGGGAECCLNADDYEPITEAEARQGKYKKAKQPAAPVPPQGGLSTKWTCQKCKKEWCWDGWDACPICRHIRGQPAAPVAPDVEKENIGIGIRDKSVVELAYKSSVLRTSLDKPAVKKKRVSLDDVFDALKSTPCPSCEKLKEENAELKELLTKTAEELVAIGYKLNSHALNQAKGEKWK